LKWCPVLRQMREIALRQTLLVRVTSDTQKIQSSDCLKWRWTLWRDVHFHLFVRYNLISDGPTHGMSIRQSQYNTLLTVPASGRAWTGGERTGNTGTRGRRGWPGSHVPTTDPTPDAAGIPSDLSRNIARLIFFVFWCEKKTTFILLAIASSKEEHVILCYVLLSCMAFIHFTIIVS